MIPVTKPFLPPKAFYHDLVEGIWERNWLTNGGPLVSQLENDLAAYLGTNKLLYLTNGTVAIQIAIKALDLQGEIITTPFSYVATTSSIVWENCKPVFADIDIRTANINPSLIEPLINEQTSAILATHCFGNACDIDAIERLAKAYGLKVIYDAAHCFGTLYNGQSIFNFGDVVTTSFHATKLFHTVEGGAVFTQNQEVLSKMAYMRNFGHNGPESFAGLGINGKNSEFHAAMGLSVLPHMDDVLTERRAQYGRYKRWLNSCDVDLLTHVDACVPNCAYFPIIFTTESALLDTVQALTDRGIYPRRYFYPSLSSLDYVDADPTPRSDDLARRILCLPLYHDLSEQEQESITNIIVASVGQHSNV